MEKCSYKRVDSQYRDQHNFHVIVHLNPAFVHLLIVCESEDEQDGQLRIVAMSNILTTTFHSK